jgi:hypothetical protein
VFAPRRPSLRRAAFHTSPHTPQRQ